ncbi:MAG: hypothetical protein IKS48_07590 [Eubacterium sp.]|nr:hypothetical protein [Eubacterium sp.]
MSSSKRKTRRNSNIIRISRAARFNSTLVIFFIILIYVVASVIKSISKEPITTYKVSSSNINNNIKCTGIALRNENMINTSKSGYLIYFVRDGDKIKKGASVCTVDETGNVITTIKEAGESEEGNALFTNADYASIRSTIDTYKSSYTDETFSNLYNFKSAIDSKVMELSSQVMMQKINSGGAKVSSTLENICANESGVITYYLDGFEKKTPETLSEDDFNQNNYKKSSLKSGDILDAGSTAFKIVSDENWHIVCQITNDQAEKLKEKDSIRFTINNSPNDISASYTIAQRENTSFLIIPLKKYMVDYIDERYLSIEIIIDEHKGLKVPNTAIVEKETYKIPKDFIIQDKDSSAKTVNVQRFAKASGSDAELSSSQMTAVKLIVYKSDDDYYYVDKDAFQDSDILFDPGNTRNTPIMALERFKMQGVYLANEGIAEFVEGEIIISQDEFTILNDDGYLKEFDNIVLDSSQVEENQTLY